MANEIKLKKWNGSAWVQQYPEVRHTDIVASGTPSSSNFLRGDGAWANVGDGNTKFYAWRAINNTSNTGAGYYRIANVSGAQSSRFQIELVGRENSYGNGSLPNYAKILGQLNNDDNYDVWWFNNETGSSQVVSEVGIVDDGTSAVNIWVKVGQYAEVSATAYISDGTITTYDTNSLTTSAPTNYSGAITEYKMWNSGNDGSGSGLDADTLDNIDSTQFLRSDQSDTMTGQLEITSPGTIGGNGTIANAGLLIDDALAFDGNQIYFNSTGYINANGTLDIGYGGGTGSAIRIDTSNKVGIGTTSPENRLHINSGTTVNIAQFENDYGKTFINGSSSSINEIVSRNSDNTAYQDLTFRSQGTAQLYLDTNGNVGIGTTSPDYNLNVEGSSGIGIGQSSSTHDLVLSNRANYANDTSNSHIWVSSGSTGAFSGEGAHLVLETRQSARNIYYKVGNTTAPQHIMDYNGNVGFGTLSPHERLTVGTANARSDLSIYRSGNDISASTDVGRLTFDVDYNASAIVMGELVSRSTPDSAFRGALDLKVKSTSGSILTGLTVYGTVSDGPRVGIGTATPSHTLHISGDTRIEGDLTVNGNYTQVNTVENTTEQWNVTNDGTGPAVTINQTGAQPVIDIQDDGTSVFYIEDGGNVGIKTTDPTTDFEVSGRTLSTTFSARTNSSRDKYRLYDTSSQYTIGMQSGVSYGGLNDWAMTFQFNNENDRGFWWGDTSHSTAQGAMALTTNGLLTVANRIRVGYGEADTTTPANYALDANGDIQISNSNPVLRLNDTGTTTGDAYIDYQAGTSLKVHAGADPITFIAGNSEKARLTAGNGYLGIGTTNPSYAIDVQKSSAQMRVYGTTAKIWAQNSGTGQASLELKNTNTHLRFIGSNGGYSIYDQLSGAERFAIDSNGNSKIIGNLTVQSTYPRIYLTDTDSNNDFSIINGNGTFSIYDDTAGLMRMQINSSGDTTFGSGAIIVDDYVYAHANLLTKGNLYLNYDNNPAGADATIYFGDDASDTAHYFQFDSSHNNFKASNSLETQGSLISHSNLYLNYDNSPSGTDPRVYFGDDSSDTAHYIEFDNSAQQFGISNRLVGTAGRLGAIEYNGSDVDKVNFALSGSTLTITTS